MAPKSSKAPKPSKARGPSSGSQHLPDIDPNSSFTPESFEKELQALASKAKDETWTKIAIEQVSLYLKAVALLAFVGVYSNVSQLALSPIYGQIPASAWHSRLIMLACFVGWSANLLLNRVLPVKPHFLLPLIAAYIPVVQFFLTKLSGSLTASWGPLVIESLTFFPIVVFSVACTANYLDGADLSALPNWIADAAPGLGSYGVFRATESISATVLQGIIGKNLALTRIGLQAVLTACYSLFAPSKLLLLAIPGVLHTAFLNTHLQTSLATSALNDTLHSNNWILLDRKESVTGYVSVIESLTEGFRLLRCDHSLLGGEWVKFKGTSRFEGNKVAEPIYGVFTMLEAVSLVQVPDPVPDNEASALVM